MNAARKPRPYMNVSAFMDVMERFPDEERWELLGGELVMMSPQSERHQRIVGNLWARCRDAAETRGCVALAGLGLLSDAVDDYAPIPDIVVRCGPMVEGGYAKDPVLVAEVLSPSTMRWDRGGKVEFYQTIPSLQAILLVYQDEMRVELWLRDGSAWRKDVRQGRHASFVLEPFADTIMMADIYANVSVDE